MSIQKLLAEMIENLLNNDIIALEKNDIEYKKILYSDIPSIISNAFDINGLYYIPKYVPKHEIDHLKNLIAENIKLEPISSSANSRRVAHYGYFYSYDRTGLKPADPIPLDLHKLADSKRINKLVDGLINKEFDQVIINEYKPGQQIYYHTDHTKLFGEIIACVTIGQPVPIKFKYGNTIKKINVEEGSMYIMTGDARYKWQHSLINNTKDTRYSITYRTINKH